jgi:hypothetical protein
MITTQIVMSDGNCMFARFVAMIGRETWKKQIAWIERAQRQQPFVGAYRRDQYRLIQAIERYAEIFDSKGAVSEHEIVAEGLDCAVDFMTRVLSLADACDQESWDNFVGRVKNALRDLSALRGLELEMNTASYYTSQGFPVRWRELEEGYDPKSTTYDLFVEDVVDGGLEVECKSVMEDTGRQISRESARGLHGVLIKFLAPLLENLSVGVAVAISIPERFGKALKSYEQQATLAKEILTDISNIVAGENSASKNHKYSNDVRVQIQRFDLSALNGLDLEDMSFYGAQQARVVFGRLTGTAWFDDTTYFCEPSHKGEGVLIVALRSEKPDQFVDKVARTAKDAAKMQLTGRGPGLLVLGLPISSVDLEKSSLSQLDQIAEKVFASEACRHVKGIWFTAESRVLRQGVSVREIGAKTYCCMREAFLGRTSTTDDLVEP